jgi:hypothetical protein
MSNSLAQLTNTCFKVGDLFLANISLMLVLVFTFILNVLCVVQLDSHVEDSIRIRISPEGFFPIE